MTTPGGPRIEPLEPAAFSPQAQAALARWQPPMNFHRTMAHHPVTLAAWIGFGEHILFDNLLPPRTRELIILRIAANLGCDYEWGAHRKYALAEQWLTGEVADRLAAPIDPEQWSAQDIALLQAVDELQRDGAIGDQTWAILTGYGYTAAHFIDLIFLVGEFIMVGMFMKSFRITPEDGFVPVPRS